MPAPTYECMGEETSHCRQCCGTTGCNSLWSSGSIGNVDFDFHPKSEFRTRGTLKATKYKLNRKYFLKLFTSIYKVAN